jgi:hypothetical protein
MSNMKLIRSSVLTILAVLMPMAVTVVKANPNTVILDTTTYYPGLGGGEFTAYTSQNFLGNYAAPAIVAGGFETFCMETGVEFSPGASYYYTLGNVTQPNPGNAQQGSGLALSKGTAYLYYQFGKDLLTDFDYTSVAGRMADDNLLQAAIWYLQGGQTYSGYPTPITSNKFYIDATNALGDSVLDAYTGTSVKVLQVWDNPNDSGAAQNQLVLVPDGGLTVSLLGGALIGLQVLRRKFFY